MKSNIRIARHLLRLSRLLLGRRRNAAWSWHDYGAWLLPNGNLLKVGEVEGHDDAAKRFIKEQEGVRVSNGYGEASHRGWVRLVFSPEFEVEINKPLSYSQKSELVEMIDDAPGKDFDIEFRFRHMRTSSPEEAKDMLSGLS